MDATEFETRCEAHRQALVAYAYTCCGQLDLAEDIVQETLLTALQKREQYFPEADFTAWLLSIAKRVWYRERDRRKLRSRHTPFLDDHADQFFTPELYRAADWENEREALRGCMGKLPEADRDLLQAHFSGNKPYATIASEARRTLAWVKVRMFRIRAALQDCVRRTLSTTEGRS